MFAVKDFISIIRNHSLEQTVHSFRNKKKNNNMKYDIYFEYQSEILD